MKQRPDTGKHEFRAVVLDLDGTLFQKDKTVSERTIQILRQWRQMGKEIIIATGRPPRFVFGRIPERIQYGHSVCYNGAQVYQDRQLIYQSLISGAAVSEILEWLQFQYPGCTLSVEVDDCLFSNCSLEKYGAHIEHQVVDFNSREFKNAAKILVDIREITDISLMDTHLPGNCQMVVTGNAWGEIFLKDVSKLAGVKLVLDSLGFALEEVVAFGDENNDLELIAAAGLGVAMGNATAEVKQVAGLVTATNEEDGIALILEKIVAARLDKNVLTDLVS